MKKQDYVVHLTPINNTMIASARIAQFISKTLRIPLITDAEACKAACLNADVVFVVNGPPAFCRFRNELAALFAVAKTVVWCQNDYTIYPPSQTNKVSRLRGWVDDKGHIRLPYVLGTIPDRATNYINWNALTMGEPLDWGRGRKGIVYYGAFRQNRKAQFKKYFSVPDITISAPVAATKRFKELLSDRRVSYVPPFADLIKDLSKFEATVLLQDERSNKRFMSLPNRFYECLQAGVAQYVSREMVSSLNKAGYKVDEKWTVVDGGELYLLTSDGHRKIARAQRAEWANIALRERTSLSSILIGVYKHVRDQNK